MNFNILFHRLLQTAKFQKAEAKANHEGKRNTLVLQKIDAENLVNEGGCLKDPQSTRRSRAINFATVRKPFKRIDCRHQKGNQ